MRTHILLAALCLLLIGCPPGGDDDDDSAGVTDDDDAVDDDDVADDDDSALDDDDAADDDDSAVDDDDDDAVDDDDSAPPQTSYYEVGYGRSFGECWGTCRWDISAVGNAWSILVRNWDDTVLFTLDTALTAAGQADLNAAVEGIDIGTLDPVYGCPDCDDGGAEYATFQFSMEGPMFQSQYEFGNPPAPLATLDAAWDATLVEATTCTFTYWLEAVACTPLPL